MNKVKQYDDLKNAQITDSNGSAKVDLNAYESDAKAVLMSDTKTDLNTGEVTHLNLQSHKILVIRILN